MRKIQGVACFFYFKLTGCSKVGVSFRNEHWQLEGSDYGCQAHAQAVKLMSSERARLFRGEERSQIWIQDYKGQQFFFFLEWLKDELFTTKIAISANQNKYSQFWFHSDFTSQFIVNASMPWMQDHACTFSAALTCIAFIDSHVITCIIVSCHNGQCTLLPKYASCCCYIVLVFRGQALQR